MGKKQKQLSSEEQRERAEARRLANGIADGHIAPSRGAKSGKAGIVAGDTNTMVKTGKGHKQRGAGSVLTSRSPVETRSGIMKKDWQRLPTQLLSEWCQREKRPRPAYNRARSTSNRGGGGKKAEESNEEEQEENYEEEWKKYHPDYMKKKEVELEPTEFRQRVLLRDPKHNDRSLSFCPVQTSPTLELAREHAALLALLHVNTDLPLERKLPDEFRDVWLQSKAAASSGTNAKRKDGKAASMASRPHSSTEGAANGGANGGSGGGGGGGGSSSSSSNSSSSGRSGVKDGQVATKGTARGPSNATGVLSLSSDRQFASRAEARAASEKRTAESNEHRRKREALERANQDAPVFMSAAMRQLLESALGLQTVTPSSSERGCGDGTSDIMLHLVAGSAERAAAEEAVRAGFSEEAAVHAVRSIGSQIDGDETDGATEGLCERVLEWLCLHCREEDLPEGFSAVGKMLDVSFSVSSSEPKLLKAQKKMQKQQQQQQEKQQKVSILAKTPAPKDAAAQNTVVTSPYGFKAIDLNGICAAIECVVAPPSTARTSIAWPLNGTDAACLLVMCHRLDQLTQAGAVAQEQVTTATHDEVTESIANEVVALESIYSVDSFSRYEVMSARFDNTVDASQGASFPVLILTVALEDGPTIDMLLPKLTAAPHTMGTEHEKKHSASTEVLMHVAAYKKAVDAGHIYPRAPPAILLRGGDLAAQVVLARKVRSIWNEASSSGIDVPSVLYDVVDWVSGAYSSAEGANAFCVEEPTTTSTIATADIEAMASIFSKSPQPPLALATDTSPPPPPPPVALDFPKTNKVEPKNDEVTELVAPLSSLSASTSKIGHTRRPPSRRQQRGFWDMPARPGPHSDSSHPLVPVPAAMKRCRENLPAFKSRAEVLQLLATNQVILVSGGTGCGKTTQVPQFILEDAFRADTEASNRKGRCSDAVKIVVAQPRRIAAIGVATRVAEELGEKAAGIGIGSPGSRVGYMVRGDSKCDAKSCQLLFCTTGVLLQRLRRNEDGKEKESGSDGLLETITHLIVDEVHERHLDADFLLAALKIILPRRPDLKVIMMSATLDQARFASYFGDLPSVVLEGKATAKQRRTTPVVDIPGFAYPVTDLFLDDVAGLTGYVPRNLQSRRAKGASSGDKVIEHDYEDWQDSTTATTSTDRFGGGSKQAKKGSEIGGAWDVAAALDTRLIATLVHRLIGDGAQGPDGSLLIFLPGVGEISRLCNELTRSNRRSAGSNRAQYTEGDDDGDADEGTAEAEKDAMQSNPLHVLPLHGALPAADQSRVFGPPPRGKVKVVVATNIAETSITISDCTIVIDSCRCKQTGFDPASSMPFLADSWAAQDALKQRRGRAGRVRSGKCYRLITKKHFESLPAHTTPEICRSPLEQLVLSVKANGYGSPQKFLATFLDAPSPDAVSSAVASLRAINALSQKPVGSHTGGTPASGAGGGGGGGRLQLTALGSHLARLPCSPRIGKLLVYGALLGVLEPILSIAASLSLRSPLLAPTQAQRDEQWRREREGSSAPATDSSSHRSRLQKVSHCGRSDHCFLAAVFDAWRADPSSRARRMLCETLGLSYVRMVEIGQLRKQFADSLESLGFAAQQREKLNRGGISQDQNSILTPPLLVDLGNDYPASSVRVIVRSVAEWRIVSAVLCAALWPNVIKIRKPVQKYHDTSGGAFATLAAAKELTFRVQRQVGNGDTDLAARRSQHSQQHLQQQSSCGWKPPTTPGALFEERVWIHPSSLIFKENKFSSPWLVYNECVVTSKAFIRDATEVSPYAMLLLGGTISVNIQNGTIAVQTPSMIAAAAATAEATKANGDKNGDNNNDGKKRTVSASGFDRTDGSQWVRFSAVPRIGVLMNALRKRIDELLNAKIHDPGKAITRDPATLAAVRLLVTEGMG